MNADDLNRELLLIMSRNLAILSKETLSDRRLRFEDVNDMLRSIAANIAQAYAHRLMPEPANEDRFSTGNPGRS